MADKVIRMSDGRLEAYEDLLITASNKTGDVRDGINAVLSAFTTATDARGVCWGNDSLGSQFANGSNGYLASKGNMIEGVRNMAGTFDNFSTSQAQSAAYLSSQDQQNADQF